MRTTSNSTRKLTVSYRDELIKWIKLDPKKGAGYLNAAWEEGPDAFLVALKDVVDAKGGITKLAKKTGMHRVSLHGVLSKAGNPRLQNLSRILDALNMRFTLAPKTVAKRRAKAG
jgi:probable addiction module antidote protein